MDFFFHLVRALVQKIQTVNKILCSIADRGKWRQIQSVISKYVAYDISFCPVGVVNQEH